MSTNSNKTIQKVEILENLNLFLTSAVNSFSTELNSGLTYSIFQNALYTSIGNGTVRHYDSNDNVSLADQVVSTFQLSDKLVPVTIDSVVKTGMYGNSSINFPTSNYYYSAPLFLQPLSVIQPDYFVIYGVNKEDKSIKLFYFCNIYEMLLKQLLETPDFLTSNKIVNKFNEFNSGIYSIDGYSYISNTQQSIIKYFSGRMLNFDSSFENQSVVFSDLVKNNCIIPNVLDIRYYFKLDSSVNLDEYEIIGEYIVKNELTDVEIDIDYLNERYELNIKNDIYFPPGLEISEFKIKDEIPFNKTNYYIFENQEFETVLTVDENSILKTFEDFRISDILGASKSDVTVAKIKNFYDTIPANFLISLNDDLESNSNCFASGSKISLLDNDVQYNIVFKNIGGKDKCGICNEDALPCHFPQQTIEFNTDNILFEADSSIEFILPYYVDLDEFSDVSFRIGNYSDTATIFKVRNSLSRNETRFNIYFTEESYKKIKREYMGMKWYFTFDKKERYELYINTLENLSNLSYIQKIHDSYLTFYNYCDLTAYPVIRSDGSLLLLSTSGDYENGKSNKEIRFILSKKSDVSHLYLNNLQFKGVHFSRLSESRFNYSICDFLNYSTGTIHLEIDKKYLSEFYDKDSITITLLGSMDFQRYKFGQEFAICGSNEDVDSIIVSIPNAFKNYFSKNELMIGERKQNKISVYDIAPIYQEIVSTLRYLFTSSDNVVESVVSCGFESAYEFKNVDNIVETLFPCGTEVTTTYKPVENFVFSVVPCFNTIVDSFEHLDNDVGFVVPCYNDVINTFLDITTDVDYDGDPISTPANTYDNDKNDINIITPCNTEVTTSQTFFFNTINYIVPCWNNVILSFKPLDNFIPNVIPCESEITTTFNCYDNNVIEIIPCETIVSNEYVNIYNKVDVVTPCITYVNESYYGSENVVINVIPCWNTSSEVYVPVETETNVVVPCETDIITTFVNTSTETDYDGNSTITNKHTFETDVENVITVVPCWNDSVLTFADKTTQTDYDGSSWIDINTGWSDGTTTIDYNENTQIIVRNVFGEGGNIVGYIIPCTNITSEVYVNEENIVNVIIPCETEITTVYNEGSTDVDYDGNGKVDVKTTYEYDRNDIVVTIPCETIVTTSVADNTTELDYNGNTYNLTTTKFVSDDINVINVIPCYSGTDSNYEDSTTTINYNIDTQISSTVTYNDIYNITIESIPCETEITTTFVGGDTELDYNGNGKVDINTGWNDGTTTIDPDTDSLVINRNTYRFVNDIIEVIPCDTITSDVWTSDENKVFNIIPCETIITTSVTNITTELDYNGDSTILPINTFTNIGGDINYDGNNVVTPQNTFDIPSTPLDYNIDGKLIVVNTFTINENNVNVTIPCETDTSETYNDSTTIINYNIDSDVNIRNTFVTVGGEINYDIEPGIDINTGWNDGTTGSDYNGDSTIIIKNTFTTEGEIISVIPCETIISETVTDHTTPLDYNIETDVEYRVTFVGTDTQTNYNGDSTIIPHNTFSIPSTPLDYNIDGKLIVKNLFEINVNNVDVTTPCETEVVTNVVDITTPIDYDGNGWIDVNTGWSDATTTVDHDVDSSTTIKNTFINITDQIDVDTDSTITIVNVFVGGNTEVINVIPCYTGTDSNYNDETTNINYNIDSEVINKNTFTTISGKVDYDIEPNADINTGWNDGTSIINYNINSLVINRNTFENDINIINVTIPCETEYSTGYNDNTNVINYNIDTDITLVNTYIGNTTQTDFDGDSERIITNTFTNGEINVTNIILCETIVSETIVDTTTPLDYNVSGDVDVNTGYNDGTSIINYNIDGNVYPLNSTGITTPVNYDVETIVTTLHSIGVTTGVDYNVETGSTTHVTFVSGDSTIDYDGNTNNEHTITYIGGNTELDYNGNNIITSTITYSDIKNDVNITIPCETIVSESYNDSTTVLDYDASSYRISTVTYIGTDTTIDYNGSSYVDVNTGWNNYSTPLDYNIDSTRFTTVTYESDENDVNVVIPAGTEISTNVVDKTTTINFNIDSYRLVKYTYVGSSSEIDVDIDGGIDITHNYEYVFNNVEVTIPCETIISESYQDSTTELDYNGNIERDILNTFTERTIPTDYNENSWVDVNVGYSDGTNPLDYNGNSTIITKNDFTVIQTDVDFDGNSIITVLNTVGNTTTLDYNGNTWLDVNVGYVDGSTGVDYNVETGSITRITFVGNDNELDVDIDGGISVKQVYNDVEIISECVIPCETISSTSYVEHTNEIDYNGDSTINVLNSTGTSTAIDYNGSGYIDVNTGWNDGTTGSDFDVQCSVTVLNSVGVTSSIDFDNTGSVIIANSYPNVSTNVDYDGNNIITSINIFENISSETDFDNSSYRLTLNTFEDNDPTAGTNEIDLNVDTYIQYINPNYSQVDANTREAKNGDLDIILKRVEGGCYSAESWTADTVGGIFPTKSKQKVIETEFYMSETLITQQMWKLVMEGNTNGIMLKPVEDPDFAATQNLVENATYGDNKPVYNISFYEAIVFCNRLSKMFGKEPLYTIMGSKDPDDWGTVPNYNDSSWNNVEYDFDADGFGLPSMSQWFYAAYEGNASAYSRYTKFNQQSGYYWYDNYRYNNGTSGYSCVYPAYKGVDSFTISPSTNQTLIHNVKSYTANNLGLYDMLTEVNMLSFDIKRPTVYSYIDEQNRGWYPISELGRLVIDETAYSNNQQSITVGESTDTIPVPDPITIPEEYTYLEGWPINYMPYKEYIDQSGLIDCTNSINNYRGIIPAYMSRTTYYEPFTNGQPVLPGNINITGSYYISNFAPDTIFNNFDTKQTFIDFMLNNNGINYCSQAVESGEDSKYTTNDLNNNSHFNQWNSMSNTIRNEISRTDMYNKVWTPNCSGISQNELELQYMNSLKTGNYDDIQNKNGFRIVQNVPSSYSEFDTYNIHDYYSALYKDYLKTYIVIRSGSNIVLLNKIDSGDFES